MRPASALAERERKKERRVADGNGWVGDGDRWDGHGVGIGTGVMGTGWGWGETCGDGVGMGRTSCPRAALYSCNHTIRTSPGHNRLLTSTGNEETRITQGAANHWKLFYQLTGCDVAKLQTEI